MSWRVLLAAMAAGVAAAVFIYLAAGLGSPGPAVNAPLAPQSPRDASSLGEPGPEPMLSFAPEEGQTITYAVEFSRSSTFEIGALYPSLDGLSIPTQTPWEERFNARLTLRFFRQGFFSWRALASFRAPRLDLDGLPAAWAPALARPFIIELNAAGYILGLTLPEGLNEGAARLIRAVVLELGAALPGDFSPDWRAWETDAVGRYRSVYTLGPTSWKGGALVATKLKLDYEEITGNPTLFTLPGDVRARLVNGRARVRLTPGGPWLENLELTQGLVLSRLGRDFGQVNTRLRASMAPATAPPGWPQTLEAARLLVAGAARQDAPGAPEPLVAGIGGALGVEDALALFTLLAGQEDQTLADGFMAGYLKRRPEAAVRLVELLDGSGPAGMPPWLQARLWALVSASTAPQAQEAVLDAASDASRADLTRLRALAYLSDSQEAGQQALARLWSLVETNLDAGPGLAAQLRGEALVALGALAAADKLEETARDELLDRFSLALSLYTQPQTLVDTLAGAAKTGSSRLTPDILPLLTHASPDVRAAALAALAATGGPAEEIIEALETERDEAVRTSGLAALAGMDPDPLTLEWAHGLIQATREPEEQALLVRLIGRGLAKYPEYEAALVELIGQGLSRPAAFEALGHLAPAAGEGKPAAE